MNHYISVDVSKQTLSVFDGEKDLTFKNKRGLSALKRYLKRKFKTFDDLIVIYEATGVYSNYLRDFCSSERIRVFMVNPKKSSNLAKVLGNRSKTDKIDARMLYAFKNIIDEKDAKIPEIDEAVVKLSEYLSSYELIIKERVALSNHIKALRYVKDAPKEMLKELKRLIDKEKGLEKKILDEAERYIKSNERLNRGYHNLLSIPGIGRVSGIALLSVFEKYKDANRSQITALLGLDPTRKESGKSVNGKRKISKGGKGIVRTVLFFPTMSAIQHNKILKAFYKGLLERHKLKKVALIAAMKKMVLIAHGVYKSGKPFTYDYEKIGREEKICA